MKFGAKSSLSFWIIVIFVAILNYNLGNIFNLVFSDILLGNIAVSALLGYVEYYSVSRYFYDVIRGYKGDINQDIELTNQGILEVKRKRTNAEEMVSSNELLLQELDSVISEVKSKILVLHTNRNSLIESLINELDNYIEDFEYQESDIQKVLEKKIQ